jgi:glycosyltransferase involved in cell wall biosynthesis
MIIDGDNGLLVPPGDPRALAHAVNELLADPERRRTMAERGLATAIERFTPAKMANQFEALYAQLARSPH